MKQFPHNALVLCGDLQLTKNLWQDSQAALDSLSWDMGGLIALAGNTICITNVYGGGEVGKHAP
jgi:hypothetical protein